jgi:tetratricopeptide (TPR) repeat protein
LSKGIALAKKGDFENALKCYQHALDIDNNFAHAYVARGAAYVKHPVLFFLSSFSFLTFHSSRVCHSFVHMNKFEEAIKEFETALRIDPSTKNAQKYLDMTRQKVKPPAILASASRFSFSFLLSVLVRLA